MSGVDPRTRLILARLDRSDRIALSGAAKEVGNLEAQWKRKLNKKIAEMTERVLVHIERTGSFPPDWLVDDFYPLITEHSFEIAARAMKTAESDREKRIDPSKKLAKPPKGRFPNNLKDLMKLWDEWRTGSYQPKRQKILADGLKKAYLKKVRDAFDRNSEDFLNGKTAEKAEAKRAIREAADTTNARASMIVETETTRNYNQARRAVYDRSKDVVAYLYMAIRDKATTAWCKTRTGLVYDREDPRLDKETPPIHWNCRSEILPLTRQNPKHLALIEDESLNRRNHHCEPLPKGWN